MQIYTLVIIILSLFGVAIVTGTFIAVYLYGRYKAQNNPKEAFIFVKNGNSVGRPIKGRLMDKSSKGYAYIYNKKDIVTVPKEYKEVYHRSKRMLFIGQIGEMVALPFDGDKPLSKSERENLIYELVESKIGADIIRSIKSKSKMPSIIMIGVIVFVVAIIAIVGYNFMQGTMTQPTTPQPPANTLPNEPHIIN